MTHRDFTSEEGSLLRYYLSLIVWIDVFEAPGSCRANLDDRLLFRPHKMFRSRWHGDEATSRVGLQLSFVKFFTHTDVELTGDHRDDFIDRVSVWWNSVVRRKFETHDEHALFGRVPIED